MSGSARSNEFALRGETNGGLIAGIKRLPCLKRLNHDAAESILSGMAPNAFCEKAEILRFWCSDFVIAAPDFQPSRNVLIKGLHRGSHVIDDFGRARKERQDVASIFVLVHRRCLRRSKDGTVIFPVSAVSSSAPRSEDWPKCSCRSFLIVDLSFSIKSARYCASVSAAKRAARVSRHHQAANHRRSSPTIESQGAVLV
jgi:hypothetical protein